MSSLPLCSLQMLCAHSSPRFRSESGRTDGRRHPTGFGHMLMSVSLLMLSAALLDWRYWAPWTRSEDCSRTSSVRGMPLWARMLWSIKCFLRVDNKTGPRKVRNQSPLMRNDVKVLGGCGMDLRPLCNSLSSSPFTAPIRSRISTSHVPLDYRGLRTSFLVHLSPPPFLSTP